MLIACIAVYAIPAEAAPKQAVKKIVKQVGKACDDVGSALWKNKGGIAVGAATVVAVTNPEPFVQGATTIVTGTAKPIHQSTLGSVFFYLLLTGLTVAGVRYLFHHLKDWKNWLPLLVVGILLCCGNIAEAGVMEGVSVIPVRSLWDFLGFILLILSIFI